MTYVTKDKRVQDILEDLDAGAITRPQAAERIKDLPPQKDASFRYLNWEVDEALRTAA